MTNFNFVSPKFWQSASQVGAPQCGACKIQVQIELCRVARNVAIPTLEPSYQKAWHKAGETILLWMLLVRIPSACTEHWYFVQACPYSVRDRAKAQEEDEVGHCLPSGVLNTPIALEGRDSITGKSRNSFILLSVKWGKLQLSWWNNLKKLGVNSRGERRVRWKIFFVLFIKTSIGK